MRRLVIGGPTLASVPASFANDLARLYAFTKESGHWESVELMFQPATYVHVGREVVLRGALERQASDVLWLDTDMEFPPDTATRLARRDRPVVACNCVMKTTRCIFTAMRGGKRIETTPDATGLEAVDTVGMAVMLMRTTVVTDLERPYFRHGLNATGEDVGEDVQFCRNLRAAGYDIWIDHDVSKEIGHIGQHTYRPIAREVVTA